MNTPNGRHQIKSDSLEALNEDKLLNGENGGSNLDFDISKLDFISLNQNISDVIGTKRDNHSLFEMYKGGTITQAQFDKGLEDRLEKVLGEDVDPSKFARGDFSLPKEHIPEMLAVISAYTGVPLTSFYNSSSEEENDILAGILEKQKQQKINKKKLAEQEAERQRLALKEHQRLAREAGLAEKARLDEAARLAEEERIRMAKQEAADEQAKLAAEALAKQNAEQMAEERRLRLEQANKANKAAHDKKILENAQILAEQEAAVSINDNLAKIEEPTETEPLDFENLNKVNIIEDFQTQESAGMVAEEELVDAQQTDNEFKEEWYNHESTDSSTEVSGSGQVAEQPEFASNIQDDPIEDMDIKHEILKGLKTDVYSLDELKTYREESKI